MGFCICRNLEGYMVDYAVINYHFCQIFNSISKCKTVNQLLFECKKINQVCHNLVFANIFFCEPHIHAVIGIGYILAQS